MRASYLALCDLVLVAGVFLATSCAPPNDTDEDDEAYRGAIASLALVLAAEVLPVCEVRGPSVLP